MARKFVGDILAIGLFLLSIALFFFFWLNTQGLIKLAGLSGSLIVVFAEATFLWQIWGR